MDKDLDKITEEEAQQVLDFICSKFIIIAKCFGSDRLYDVLSLKISGFNEVVEDYE